SKNRRHRGPAVGERPSAGEEYAAQLSRGQRRALTGRRRSERHVAVSAPLHPDQARALERFAKDDQRLARLTAGRAAAYLKLRLLGEDAFADARCFRRA